MNTRKYSDKQEKRIAKNLNGKQTSNSGATKFIKGDVLLDDWLIEAKTSTTPVDSFAIKRKWIIKNKEEAFEMRKSYNALCIDFGMDENYYLIDEKTFKEFISILNSN